MSAPGCAGSCAGRLSAMARGTRICANQPNSPRAHGRYAERHHPPAATKRTPSGRCGHRRHPEVAPRPKRRVRAKVLPRPRHMPGVICRVTEAVFCDRFPPRIFVRTGTAVLPQIAERPGAGDPERPPATCTTTAGVRRRARFVPPAAVRGGGSGPRARPEWAARAQHTAREATQRPPGRSATRGDCGSGTRWPAAPRHSRLAEARADPRLTMQPPAAASAQSAQAGARPHIPGARAARPERRSAGAESGTVGGESSDARRMFTRGTFRAIAAFR